MLIVAVILAIGLPIAWFVSEFQNRRWVSLLLGVAALSTSFLVAYSAGSLQHLTANAWYGGASKNLIDTTLEELEKGNTEKVIDELKVLQKDFQPTYENRARYDKLIEAYMSRLGHEWRHAV